MAILHPLLAPERIGRLDKLYGGIRGRVRHEFGRAVVPNPAGNAKENVKMRGPQITDPK
jgi:hypothetical protein